MTLSSKSTDSLFASPEVCVVEASAGSGKTFALSKRYVQLLLRHPSTSGIPIPLRNILAITFTNKASLEMKARILEFLKKIALGRLSEAEHREIVKPLRISDEEASRRAFDAMEAVIRNFNFFQVQTIDSFINALLSGCSFKIHLSANFKIKRNSSDYVVQSLDRLIAAAHREKSVRRVFNEFVHQYLFIENRTGWFPKKDLLNLMGTLFAQGNSFAAGYKPVNLQGEDLLARKKVILKSMTALRAVLPDNTHARFRESLETFLTAHPDGFDLDHISDYFNREEFPLTKGKPLPDEVERLWKTIHRGLKDACEMEAMSIFNPYIHVFGLMTEELQAIAVKEDVLFLEQLNKKARGLFDEGLVTVEELYYRLATRFHHYMVDEFQDTSRLQWDNLSMMVEEALSTGGTFFYVGDKKQAIYSFRGGDNRLFDEVKANFQVFQVKEEALTHNFRSRRNIVEFNNAVFSTENLERFVMLKEEEGKKDGVALSEADRRELRHIFANTHQVPKDGFDGGLVRVEWIEGQNREDRDQVTCDQLLERLLDLRGRFSFSDIAILARNNSDVETMTGWLLEAGIPVESERTSNIQTHPVIGELVAFLKFLDSPIDNVSFVHFILGDVFGRASGANAAELHSFVFSLREKLSKDATFYIYKEFRERYPGLWEKFFDDFFKNVGLYPLYEFVINVVSRLAIAQHCPEAQGFVMHFLEIIKRQEKERGDLTGFLEYFGDPLPEDLFVHVTDHDSVRILTIHKAKGLEFPVVILPSLEMEVKVGSGGRDGQQSFIMHHADDGIHLLRLKDKYRHFSSRLDELYQAEYKRSLFSELNNAYVALTRAVHELYVFIPSKAGSSQNIARYLIPGELFNIGSAVQGSIKKTAAQPRVKLPFAPHKDWLHFLKDEFVDVQGRRELRRRGEAVHFLLSFVRDANRTSLAEAMSLARREAGLRFPEVDDWDQLQEEVEALVDDPKLKPFFNVGHDRVLREVEVVNASGHVKRLDRMIFGSDGIDIIDFKSSREGEEEHRGQITEYVELIAGLHPKQAVRGWLIYLNDRTLEAVYKTS